MSLLLWFVIVFLLGLFAGGFVNHCVRRLPYERSLLWPGPRCLKCFQPVHWFDCLPVIGYALSRGRCRTCHQPTTLRDPIVALVTGVLFVALLALVVGELPVPLGEAGGLAAKGQQKAEVVSKEEEPLHPRWNHDPNVVPGRAAVFFLHYALLTCFLLTASVCDLADMEIPFSVPLFGTAVGLVMATLFPWPYPLALDDKATWPVNEMGNYPAVSLYPWPVWEPNHLSRWLTLGSPLSGLLTGLAGAAAGTAIPRGIGFLYQMARGKEGMGVGDADLMMMAGAFLGWQMVIIAFFVAVFPGLLFALVHLAVRRSQKLPFGPSLAVGVILAILFWPVLGNYVGPLFFYDNGKFVLGIFGGTAVMLLILALLMWVFRWMMGDDDEGGDSHESGRRPPVQVPTTPPAPSAPNEGVKCDPS